MPETTIITAAHLDTPDKVKFLRELAENLISQEFEDWEWIVVDDHSPAAPDLPSDVRIRHKGLRAVSRSGPAACRNVGVALARTESVVVIDADDMLATPQTLGNLHAAWSERKDHFVYGNLQVMHDGQRGRVVALGPYSFQDSLEPKGIVPVTAMHSVECWRAAGGWKAGLDAGLEDVEYWIAAGAAGFCGWKLDETVLVYRQHPGQRTQAMRSAHRQREMEARIREMHPDLYEGRYPMGCCGGGRATKPLPQSASRPAMRAPSPLQAEIDLPGGRVWVRYNGGRMAEFRVKGPTTGFMYVINGTGHTLQVWAQDSHFFRSCGRGKDFTVGVPPPEVPEPEPEPVAEEPAYQAPAPELATIERLDPVGEQTRGAPVPRESETAQAHDTGLEELDADVEALLEGVPSMREQDESAVREQQASGDPLAGLGMAYFRGDPAPVLSMLAGEGWTVASLAAADVEELTPYPGVGKVTAAQLIAEANRLWSG